PLTKPPLAKPAQPTLAKPPLAQPPLAKPAQPPLSKPAVPLARPVAPPSPTVRSGASKAVEDALVERTARETGFDPRSGKVVDAARFQKWKRETAGPSSPGGSSNSTLFEDFHRARAAVEHWLDEEANRHYILDCDHRGIREEPTIQGIFKFYEK